MKTTFTKSTAKFGCYKENDDEQDNYLKSETFTIEDVLNAQVPLKDKAWFIRFNCEFTDRQFQEFAIGCALCVLPLYEEKYPDNKAPREVIKAAGAYLAGTIDLDELSIKRRNAAAAADAADAAAAADAADAAAAAAADAADAAAYAANAAAVAYTAAYAAVAYTAARNSNASYQEKLLQFFKDFTSDKEQLEKSKEA